MVKFIIVDKIKILSIKSYEQVFLDKQSHVGKKDKERTKGFFSCINFLL
jgi:hypothetical protein